MSEWSLFSPPHHRTTHVRAGKAGRQEANLASVLACVVGVLLLCHVPRLVITLNELLMIDQHIR